MFFINDKLQKLFKIQIWFKATKGKRYCETNCVTIKDIYHYINRGYKIKFWID